MYFGYNYLKYGYDDYYDDYLAKKYDYGKFDDYLAKKYDHKYKKYDDYLTKKYDDVVKGLRDYAGLIPRYNDISFSFPNDTYDTNSGRDFPTQCASRARSGQ